MGKRLRSVQTSSQFDENGFLEICGALEEQSCVRVSVRSIGYTANNSGQEIYKELLRGKYGDKLVIQRMKKESYTYAYCYQLNEEEK